MFKNSGNVQEFKMDVTSKCQKMAVTSKKNMKKGERNKK